MAKKDNTIYYVAGLAVLGGGYYAYKKGLFNKLMGKGNPMPTGALTSGTSTTSDAAIVNKAEAVLTQAARAANPLTDPNSYQSKVAFIQTKIGVTPDGIAGAETNKAFSSIYGFDKDAFSPSNIDYYVARVKANNTKAQIAALNAKIATAATLSNRTISSFKSAWDAGYRSWALTMPFSASEFLADKASNSLKPTGKKVLFNNGDLMLKGFLGLPMRPTNAVWGNSTISLSFDGGKTFYSFLPANLVLNK
jgi:hypothetical protein